MPTSNIYLEIGKKKVFAVAVDWPGWCRWGKDEASAIQTLWDSGPRYRQVLQQVNVDFQLPEAATSLNIIDRVAGDATTDFGAPGKLIADDWEPMSPPEVSRLNELLRGCWISFDEAVKMAQGKELRKGPRGGGRDLRSIIAHVLAADESYLKKLGWKWKAGDEEDTAQRITDIRGEILNGLAVAAGGQLPRQGPRGGSRWPARFFVRRLAWHVVDHAWEIEDRIA